MALVIDICAVIRFAFVCVETLIVFYRNLSTSFIIIQYRSFPAHLVVKKSDAESRLAIKKKSNRTSFNPVSPTSCHLVRDILAKVELDK